VSHCKIYPGEKLLYLFYGKPAYRPANDGKTSLEMWRALITFVINPEAVKDIHRIFPFDSGAFVNGLYDLYLGEGFAVSEFELPNRISIAQHIVGGFFGNNTDYWEGNLQEKCLTDIDPLDFHSQVYTAMNHAANSTEFDCRAGVIEVQSQTSLPLNSDTLEAIIVPDQLLAHKDIRSLASECGAEIIGYRWRKNRVAERARDIDDALFDWLRKSGRL
jgi:hypothetical protein